jgi:hypothetical protein
LIFILIGLLEIVASLFFIRPGQEIIPGEVGSGKYLKPVRSVFKHPGYILVRNGAATALIGGIVLSLMKIL